MPSVNLSNTAVATTLDTGIAAGDSSLVVASATGYPAASFYIVIDPDLATEEIILVGAKSGTTFSSLTRGQGGTSAASHSAGAAIRHVVIASDIEDVVDHRWASPATAADTDGSASTIHHTLETTASTQAIGDAASAGASFKAAPGLHKHAMPAFAGTGAAATIARSDHTHSGGATTVRKTADESVTSSTTLQDDDALLFAIGASEKWAFEIVVFFTAGATGDFKATVTAPSGATGQWGIASSWSPVDAFSIPNFASFGTAFTFGGGVDRVLVIKGCCINSTNAGSVTLQFAQGTSDGTASTVKAGSYLIAHQLS